MCHALGEAFTNIMVFQGYTVDSGLNHYFVEHIIAWLAGSPTSTH